MSGDTTSPFDTPTEYPSIRILSEDGDIASDFQIWRLIIIRRLLSNFGMNVRRRATNFCFHQQKS